MNNPFELIIPRENEIMINESFLKEISLKIKEHVKEKHVIFIEGDYGSGKSLYMSRIYKRLTTKKEWLEFTDVTTTILEGKVAVINKSLFINNFDLVTGLNEEQLAKLTASIINLADDGMIFIIACRKETVNKILNFNPLLRSRIQRFKIPSLSFDEAKELILNRLNEARKEKTDDLSPFNERELRMIHLKSKGNPRMMLLLLSPLFDQRMTLKE